MSEVIALSTGQQETIHGTFAGAEAYLAMGFGEPYTTWRALKGSGATADDAQKQTLALAVRYLNAQAWTGDADTFAKRDAIAAFATAQYELAALIAADPGIVAAADQGSNIKAAKAGSASVEYFAPRTKGATKLPPILMRLVGQYLAAPTASALDGGGGQSGSCKNPFSDCADYDRKDPF